jgi:hypothetical protein
MSGSATNATNANLLRRLFGPELINMMWRDDAYLAGVKKVTTGFGEARVIVVRIAEVAGVGGSFVVALKNQNPTGERKFMVTERSIYSVFSMKGSFLRKMRGKPNTLLTGYQSQAQSAMRDFKKIMEHAAWNDVGGTLGQISTSVNVNAAAPIVIVFRNARALFGLNLLGKKLTLATDSGSAASPAGELGPAPGLAYTVTVTAVDEQNNSVTVTGDNGGTTLATAIPGATNNCFVFIEGFYAQSLTGKRGWNPVNSPTPGDNLFGIDRSESVNRLSGWRQLSQGLRENTLLKALTLGDMADLEQPTCFAAADDWFELVTELGSKVQRSDEPNAKGGRKVVEVYGPGGTCKVVMTNRVPSGNAWVGDPSQDMLLSEGDIPQILNEDKVGTMLRAPDDDAYQSRLGGDANFMPDDTSGSKLGPGSWVIVTW